MRVKKIRRYEGDLRLKKKNCPFLVKKKVKKNCDENLFMFGSCEL